MVRSVPTIHSSRQRLETTAQSGHWDCATRTRSRFNQARGECLSTRSDKAHGKKLMMRSAGRTTDGPYAKEFAEIQASATHFSSMEIGPDGNLYYLARGGGGVVAKVVYSGA